MKKRSTTTMTTTRAKQIQAAARRVMRTSRTNRITPDDLRRLVNLAFDAGFRAAGLMHR